MVKKAKIKGFGKKGSKDKRKDDINEGKIRDYVKLGLSVLVFLLVVAGLVYGVYWLYEQKVYKDKTEYCLNIQSSNDLKYNCTCVPDMRPVNKSDEIDRRTERMCICSCDVGREKPYILEIKKEKK